MPAKLSVWLLALRPKTLSISVIPVIVGSTLGWLQSGQLSIPVMLAALLAAMLIQIGTNLHNDAADHVNGTDDPATRAGPPRAVAQGWLSAGQVERAALGSFMLAFVIGLYLIGVGGWPILVLGLSSIAAGYCYSGGPWPIARSGFGEVFVLLFFGIVAVSGSAYLQAAQFTPVAVLCGLLLGLPAGAVLVVNNHRDRDSDARAGRKTLAVHYGPRASLYLYALGVLGPFAILPLVQHLTVATPVYYLPWLLLVWAARLLHRFAHISKAQAFNPLLAETGLFQLILGLLLSLALVAGRSLAVAH